MTVIALNKFLSVLIILRLLINQMWLRTIILKITLIHFLSGFIDLISDTLYLFLTRNKLINYTISHYPVITNINLAQCFPCNVNGALCAIYQFLSDCIIQQWITENLPYRTENNLGADTIYLQVIYTRKCRSQRKAYRS